MFVDFVQNAGSWPSMQKKSRIAVFRIGSLDSSAHSPSSILLGLTAKEDPFSRSARTDLGIVSPERLCTDCFFAAVGMVVVLSGGIEAVSVADSVAEVVSVVVVVGCVVFAAGSSVADCWRNAAADFQSGQRRQRSAL